MNHNRTKLKQEKKMSNRAITLVLWVLMSLLELYGEDNTL